MDLNRKLSNNFTLKELCRTSHRTLDNSPPPDIETNLEILVVNFLQPVRDRFGPIKVNSGYRCLELNTAIGGSKTSAHMFGCAVDFDPPAGITHQEVVNWIIDKSGMPFDQVILETSGTAEWIHLGMKKPKQQAPRKEVLFFNNGKYSLYDKTKDYGF